MSAERRVEVRLAGANLVMTSSARAEVVVQGPVDMVQLADRIVITERDNVRETHPICRLDVPNGACVEATLAFGALTAYTFRGSIRVRLQHGNAQIERSDGSFRLVSSTGQITLEHVRGSADALTSSGSIVARQIDADLQAVSDSGSIDLDEINGPLAARSTTGSISAREVRGTTRLSTRTGAISVSGAYRQLVIHTQSGDITLEASIIDHTTLETTKGSVEVRLGPKTDARIEAAARQGVVRPERLALGSGSGRRSVRSVIGQGRARLRISTGMGVIEIAGPRPTPTPLVI